MLATILNGRPMGPAVQKIFERAKVANEGDIILHDELEKLAGADRKTPRYRSIIQSAKRRIFHELGYMLLAQNGQGYKVPFGTEQQRAGVKRLGQHIRGAGRAVGVVAAVSDDRLPNPKDRQARDHIVGQAKYLVELGRTRLKELNLVVGKPEALPRG